MARTNKRLIGPTLLPSTPGLMYTVPANTRAVIQRIHVVTQAASASESFIMSIGAPASGTVVYVAGSGSSVPGLGGAWDGYGPIALGPGETIYMGASVTGSNLCAVVSGYEEPV